jgi:small GTP-binding protein
MVLGDPSVGKTSLIRRFVENRFSEEYLTTIGVEFLKKELLIDEKTKVTLVLWDVAGQAKWTQFKKAYYQGALFINQYKGFIAPIIQTSAKTGKNVNETFLKIAKFLVKKIGKRG